MLNKEKTVQVCDATMLTTVQMLVQKRFPL